MGFLGWMAAIGVLLVGMSLAAGWIRPLPLTQFALYLVVGVAVGPWGLHLLDIDFLADAHWLERLTEVALVVSLFAGGLKLRVPWRARPWRAARRLAFPGMALSIAGTALAAHLLLGLAWPLALLLAAMLAPTDPVLASAIAVDNAADHDGLRVTLSGEAGMNDGSAMPFLLLGLAWLHGALSWSALGRWALVELLWGVCVGIALGFGLGWLVGKLGTRLVSIGRDPGPGALLTAGLIAVTYAVAEAVGALGFLAVFAAGVGLRKVEVGVVQEHPHPRLPHEHDFTRTPPAEFVVRPAMDGGVDRDEPVEAVGQVVAEALTFGSVMEHLLGPLLVLLLGIALARHWEPQAWSIALVLFVLIRPLATWLTTLGMGLNWRRRLLLGWLGIRGIGGLNYLAYALVHGLDGSAARLVAGVAVTTITLSVVVHGFSAQPLLAWRRRRLAAARRKAEAR
ncbi:cation:proton antiporter [Frateuria hangzhouensis]|uniref:cation:proton antiporter domain-containing protein n=1 Tax=Frateuria hangzhouensis TaxID=2995589 RepID=UPI00226096E7|nr:cation:proton antiporter [Frateuria sp. STR12]MCX7513326.1 cation:proton antiporter [Frateuria sp. STR12]